MSRVIETDFHDLQGLFGSGSQINPEGLVRDAGISKKKRKREQKIVSPSNDESEDTHLSQYTTPTSDSTLEADDIDYSVSPSSSSDDEFISNVLIDDGHTPADSSTSSSLSSSSSSSSSSLSSSSPGIPPILPFLVPSVEIGRKSIEKIPFFIMKPDSHLVPTIESSRDGLCEYSGVPSSGIVGHDFRTKLTEKYPPFGKNWKSDMSIMVSSPSDPNPSSAASIPFCFYYKCIMKYKKLARFVVNDRSRFTLFLHEEPFYVHVLLNMLYDHSDRVLFGIRVENQKVQCDMLSLLIKYAISDHYIDIISIMVVNPVSINSFYETRLCNDPVLVGYLVSSYFVYASSDDYINSFGFHSVTKKFWEECHNFLFRTMSPENIRGFIFGVMPYYRMKKINLEAINFNVLFDVPPSIVLLDSKSREIVCIVCRKNGIKMSGLTLSMSIGYMTTTCARCRSNIDRPAEKAYKLISRITPKINIRRVLDLPHTGSITPSFKQIFKGRDIRVVLTERS